MSAAADAATELWQHADEVAAVATHETLGRAADCAALGLAEMRSASREPRWREAAAALASAPGPARLVGSTATAGIEAAITANALLMHANLADDTYLTALHPGVTILPTALALADATEPAIPGQEWLRALVAGYEVAGVLADALIPAASLRGWRVTAVVAPIAAATVAVRLLGAPQAGPAALRLAAAASGGVLTVFDQGDAWRLQPGLAAIQGLGAARAAIAGLDGSTATLGGTGGVIEMMTGDGWQAVKPAPPAILGVTFKRFRVPMYGQAVHAAFEGSRLDGEIARMTLRVPEFATAYASQDDDSVTSVAAIATAAIAELTPQARPPALTEITVIGDDGVGAHGAVVKLEMADGSRPTLEGDGDTSRWGAPEVEAQCRRLVGDAEGCELAHATRSLLATGSVARDLGSGGVQA